MWSIKHGSCHWTLFLCFFFVHFWPNFISLSLPHLSPLCLLSHISLFLYLIHTHEQTTRTILILQLVTKQLNLRGYYHGFCSLWLLLPWYLSASTMVDPSLPFTGLYPFPFSPSSLQPFFYSPPTSLPLLPQLPWCHVTVHVPMIADPNIVEVTRLASLLPIIIYSLLPPLYPSRDLHVTRPTLSGIPSHVHTLVLPAAILSWDSTLDTSVSWI